MSKLTNRLDSEGYLVRVTGELSSYVATYTVSITSPCGMFQVAEYGLPFSGRNKAVSRLIPELLYRQLNKITNEVIL